jgi:hypothetical protein
LLKPIQVTGPWRIDARHAWQQALRIFEEIRSPHAGTVRGWLAALPEPPTMATKRWRVTDGQMGDS